MASDNVIAFPGHKWEHCIRKDCMGCALCHGGLASCGVCKGGEGSLPTDCPGEAMTHEQQDAVYEGVIDYRRKDGWVRETSAHSPGYYRSE